jgi:hypothetical protein
MSSLKQLLAQLLEPLIDRLLNGDGLSDQPRQMSAAHPGKFLRPLTAFSAGPASRIKLAMILPSSVSRIQSQSARYLRLEIS